MPVNTHRIVINMQQANTTLWLAAAISRATRIEEQLPIDIFIPGDVTVAKDDYAGNGKFLAGHTGAIA